jgi:hypothetical protein
LILHAAGGCFWGFWDDMTMKKIAVIKELSLGKKEMGDRRVESGSEIMCILDAI